MNLARRPVFPGALPFPYLRHLNFVFTSPFGDDTPFRGNAATLESLNLYLDSSTTTMLRVYKGFTPTSHPRLQSVRVKWNPVLVEPRSASELAYTKFGLSIAPNAPVRKFSMLLFYPGLVSIITTLGDHKCIQVLELLHTSMHILDVIALVKALPLLSHLHSKAIPVDPLPNGIPKYELPAYVIANYSHMGKWFRC